MWNIANLLICKKVWGTWSNTLAVVAQDQRLTLHINRQVITCFYRASIRITL
ncbi:hypothetical protein KSF_078780 [Reticulibacter mediterranei]|uniref:Uncharacterized protein n=1 Tax=Reticulibacter mediterranei TaxID=2778369 RepID=A0A8J3IW06_9CHLR|nr:hypothetical protein [Reticulibacter mediterranei]GHO97830.1 hypothetical protein KSF_078780 [Reticulibacter mediterranei]